MRCCICFAAILTVASVTLLADDPVVFKSDVDLSRVDAQVVDRDGRAITGLQARDFVLRVDGKPQPIKNFDSESMPIDILLLLDVSGSMRPHVQRIADAAKQALTVLAPQDRIAIMTFDTRTRERLAFTNDRDDVGRELNNLVRFERFNGGTRITSALIEAANYVQHRARPGARRAIVILTDDETQDGEDEIRVEKALERANAVLSFLQAPYEPPTAGPMPGHRRHGGGIGFPGGGPVGFPGSGGGWPGGVGWPGGGSSGRMDPSHSAGTDTIARDSGGDTMSVDNATALEDTLARLRQRYALHFYLADADTQKQHDVRVDLSPEARIRFADAEVRSRRVFMSGSSSEQSGPTVVTHQSAPPEPTSAAGNSDARNESSSDRRHAAVSEHSSDGPSGPDGENSGSAPGGSQVSPPAPSPRGGWPAANPNYR